jgi:hypothetical protein
VACRWILVWLWNVASKFLLGELMAEEISLIRFNIMNFFALIMNSRPFNPISSTLIKIVESLIASEPEPDTKNQKRLNWIYNNTNSKVNVSLPVVELAVFKNLDRGLNREIDIGDKTFYLVELYKYLDEISKELTIMVIEIGKKYSIDIPMAGFNNKSSSTIDFSK